MKGSITKDSDGEGDCVMPMLDYDDFVDSVVEEETKRMLAKEKEHARRVREAERAGRRVN